MDASTEWVIAWTDLILDASALDEAARKRDFDEVRFRACSIALRARRHGFDELSHKAIELMERVDAKEPSPELACLQSAQGILRLVDAITKNRR
ncbi:MAG: hypothetical protein ACTHOL_17420 [Luteibacter jiangsuensis]